MSDPTDYHISDTELAEYLDGALPEARRTALEEHLAGCEACRAEFADTAQLVQRARSRFPGHWKELDTTPGSPGAASGGPPPTGGGRRRWWLVGMGTAAAVAASILLFASPEADRPVNPDQLRDAPSRGDEIARLTPKAPEVSETEEGVVLTLSWEAAADDITYRLTVTDETGAVLHTGQTNEASVTLDPLEGLSSGARLFWYVDATLANGESATTGVQSLTVP